MLRANPRVLSGALFSALGLLPLACGGTFSGVDDDDGGSSPGGSASGGSASGGSASGGSANGGSANGGSASGGKASGGKASGGSTTGGTSSAGTGSGGGNAKFPCTNPMPIGAGYEQCDGGTVHRPSVEECTSSLPRADAKPIVPPVDGQCQSDADCVDMPHGYCTSGGQLPGTYCAYGCVKDSECGVGSICVCGEPIGQCVGSSCTSDGDCGAGLRCQSYDSSHGCQIMRFACQSPDDTCGSDADCAGGYCDGASGSFTCVLGACAIGRPFLVEGEERVAVLRSRKDWAEDCALAPPAISHELRQRVARAWARIAQMEHASVAAFARFALQLLQLGAPPELVERATLAMADETRHARLAFGVASDYGGEPLGPGPLDIDRSLTSSSLVDVLRLVVREGCMGETAAALEAREAAEHAKDPRLAALLRGVAEDETRHAELAWRFVSWALEQAPLAVADVLTRELELARAAAGMPAMQASAQDLELLPHGIVPEALRQELRNTAFREVIAPCARALVARARRQLPENPVLSA